MSEVGSALTYAIQQELLTFYKGKPGTVLLHKRYRPKKMPTYQMPLVLIHKHGGSDFGQMLGGVTLEDWEIDLCIYWYRPDGYGSDPTTESADTEDIADQIRQHFSNFSVFISDELQALLNTYGTRLTLSQVSEADALPAPDGLVDGHKITFSSISWDTTTSGTIDPGKVMQNLEQLDPPPFPFS